MDVGGEPDLQARRHEIAVHIFANSKGRIWMSWLGARTGPLVVFNDAADHDHGIIAQRHLDWLENRYGNWRHPYCVKHTADKRFVQGCHCVAGVSSLVRRQIRVKIRGN